MKSLFSDIKAGKVQLIWTRTVIFLTFFVIPFLGGNSLALFYLNIDRFWIESLFTVLLTLSIASLYLGGHRRPSGFLGFSRFFLPFFAMTVISLVYSWNRFGTLLSINVLIWAAGSVYLFLVCPWKTVCLAGLVSGAAGCAVSAIIQHLVLFPNLASAFQQGMYAQILKEQSGIPFSSYSHHNMLGGYLAFIFPLAIYFVLRKKGAIAVAASIAASVLIVAGVVLSSTRIGLGIVILCLPAALLFLVLAGRGKGGIIRLCGVIVLAVIVSFCVLHAGGAPKGTGVQGVIAKKTKAVYKDLSTLNTRTDIWKNAFNAFKNKPVVGFGAGAFEYGYRKYFDGGSYTVAAHSSIVKTAVELGIAGLLTLFFYLFGVGLGVKRQQTDPLCIFLLFSACAGFLFGLVDFSFDVTSHVITFFVITSYFFVAETSANGAVSKSHAKQKELAVFLVVIICLLGMLGFNTRLGISRSDMENGDSLQENGLMIPALNVYREAMSSMPLYPDPYLRAASILVLAAENEKNEKTKEAMTGELKEYLHVLKQMGGRDSERYLVMGRGFAFLGDKEEADRYFSRAIDCYPASPYNTYEIAAYYLSMRRYDEAIRYIRAFDQYIPKFRTPHNPRGVFVYKIRDLEASIEFAEGNRENALKIAQGNLKDAEASVYTIIASTMSRNYVPKDQFLKYLHERARFFEENLTKKTEF